MRPSRFLGWRSTVASVTVLLAIAGCSSGGSSAPASPASTGATSAATPALRAWFDNPQVTGDFRGLEDATHAASEAIAEFPPNAGAACARLKTAIAAFRRDLPAPDATVQTALEQGLAQLDQGQLQCESATVLNADPTTVVSARRAASNDFPDGLRAVQTALHDGGLPVDPGS
jgi:hypothetical protein